MKILPPVTHPWSEKIVRRHTPRSLKGAKGYQAYRPCLRWEFGFSCAFCLVHEVDLAPYPIAGSGLTQVEHFIPKSRDETRRNIPRQEVTQRKTPAEGGRFVSTARSAYRRLVSQ